jgi:hypothetical protein
MVPLLRVIPQWSRQMNSRLIKGWKRGNKERWVLGRWSHQMSLKKNSSKVERERPLGGVARKARERLWDSLPKCR